LSNDRASGRYSDFDARAQQGADPLAQAVSLKAWWTQIGIKKTDNNLTVALSRFHTKDHGNTQILTTDWRLVLSGCECSPCGLDTHDEEGAILSPIGKALFDGNWVMRWPVCSGRKEP
jgi:hypothetical protein